MITGKKWFNIAGPLILALIFVGCQTTGNFRHSVLMKGSIVDWQGSEAVVCIGTNDGAKVGQELKVYKVESVKHQDKELVSTFRKVETGEVKIIEIFNEHFAKASVLKGDVKTGYLVEMN